jgi:type II restriction enzyme
VPESGKVWLAPPSTTLRVVPLPCAAGEECGEALERHAVLAQWRSTLFLRQAGLGARGWLIEVMKAVEAMGRESFTLADAYGFEARLAALYPGNHNVRPKIRQQLQVLRDQGWLEFLGRGRYRVRGFGVGI